MKVCARLTMATAITTTTSKHISGMTMYRTIMVSLYSRVLSEPLEVVGVMEVVVLSLIAGVVYTLDGVLSTGDSVLSADVCTCTGVVCIIDNDVCTEICVVDVTGTVVGELNIEVLIFDNDCVTVLLVFNV